VHRFAESKKGNLVEKGRKQRKEVEWEYQVLSAKRRKILRQHTYQASPGIMAGLEHFGCK
jgi:hypothetical protein